MKSPLTFIQLLSVLAVTIGAGLLPLVAQAQVSDRSLNAFVEALRQAAPQTGRDDDGLYSEWQIKPENIPRWSRSCLGQELTPTQFEASPATARRVVTCVMRDVLQEQYEASDGNALLAVRRAAAWWMTGDPAQYDSSTIATYLERVLTSYQQQLGATTNSPAPAAPPSAPQLADYDRYMQAGYTATQQQDYDNALLYFRRALDERPNDTYAERAIQNVEGYRRRNAENATDQSPAPTTP